MPYRIEISPRAQRHLRGFTAGERKLILDAIEEQLPHQPTVETRNRKRMRPNPLAYYELRVRHLRVFYEVVEEPEQVVLIRVIGWKEGNHFRIEGEEVEI